MIRLVAASCLAIALAASSPGIQAQPAAAPAKFDSFSDTTIKQIALQVGLTLDDTPVDYSGWRKGSALGFFAPDGGLVLVGGCNTWGKGCTSITLAAPVFFQVSDNRDRTAFAKEFNARETFGKIRMDGNHLTVTRTLALSEADTLPKLKQALMGFTFTAWRTRWGLICAPANWKPDKAVQDLVPSSLQSQLGGRRPNPKGDPCAGRSPH